MIGSGGFERVDGDVGGHSEGEGVEEGSARVFLHRTKLYLILR